MIGNIWITSSLVIATMFSTSVAYKAYKDIQEAKDIQQSFEIISQVKERIAKQYNKSPEDVTRDEIIAYLPKGPNWEKVLLVSRADGNTFKDSALLDEDGDFILSEDEKIKLMALNAKLKEYGVEQIKEESSNKIKFNVGMQEKNFSYKDSIILERVTKTIEIIYLNKDEISSKFDDIITKNTPYEDIYHDFRKYEDESPSSEEIKNRKEDYFKKRIIEKLLRSKNSKDIEIYKLIKDEL